MTTVLFLIGRYIFQTGGVYLSQIMKKKIPIKSLFIKSLEITTK